MTYNILVTGGAGYIGSILVPELLAAGNKVTVVDTFLYGTQSLLGCCASSDFCVYRGDVRDKELIRKLVRDKDVVIPLAAFVGAPICDRNQVGAVTVNRDAVRTITELLSPAQRILYPNTNSGYGIGLKGVPCTEESPLNPISLYGRTKVQAEEIILARGNAISLRLATVFGTSPRMRLDLLVNDFTYQAVTEGFLLVYEGHFMRNFIHIRDVARAFMHALDNFQEMKDQPYNVGLSDANLSKLQLCERIKEQVPAFVHSEAAVGEDVDKRDYMVSNAKIEETGFTPKYSLEMGIGELIKCYILLGPNVAAFTNNINTVDDYACVNIQGVSENRVAAPVMSVATGEPEPPSVPRGQPEPVPVSADRRNPVVSWQSRRIRNQKKRILATTARWGELIAGANEKSPEKL